MTQKQKQKINEKINSGNRAGIRGDKFFHRLKILNKLLLATIIIVVGYFVVSTNDLSIKGFVLNELWSEVNTLATNNDQIELKIMELESYDKIDKRAQELKMVKIDKIDYITINDEAVAKR